jgi:UDP-N-acetylglucosamine diphosphorylase/glucosamine-1-phosphate N-acetyltransferase
MQIVILDHNFENFYPISQTRPVWDIFYGMFHASERVEKLINNSGFNESKVKYLVREALRPFITELYPDKEIVTSIDTEDTLFLSPFISSLDEIDSTKFQTTYFSQNVFGAALIHSSDAARFSGGIDFFQSESFQSVELKNTVIPEYIWNIVSLNGKIIENDYKLVEKNSSYLPESTAVVGEKDNVIVEQNVRIDPFVVIDAVNGPVYISEGCEIHPFTRIEGPCFIGKNSLLLGAKVREGCSIGHTCRIGGEVEDSIFSPYSNKYHDGFIGHAFIGSWVNLGAGTNNSDLKNNYADVKVTTAYGDFHTGERKIGTFIGDHTKCSIGTLINTGTVISSYSMTVHCGMMVRGYLPPFTLFIKNRAREGADINTLIETIRTVMSRRKVKLLESYEKLVRYLFNETTVTRKKQQDKINERENG